MPRSASLLLVTCLSVAGGAGRSCSGDTYMLQSVVEWAIMSNVSTPPALWPQLGPDHAKCSVEESVASVNSQLECQAMAVVAGHKYYMFSASRSICFSTATCDAPIVGTVWDWAIYASLDPTAAATASPAPTSTVDPTAAPTQATPTAFGDPHLRNLKGEAFSILRLGTHTFMNIPQGAPAADSMLRIEAAVNGLSACSALFIRRLEVSGKWLGDVPTLTFSAGGGVPGAPGGAGLQVGNSSALPLEEFVARLPSSMLQITRAGAPAPNSASRHATTLLAKLVTRPGVRVEVSWVSELTGAKSAAVPTSAESLWLSVKGLSAVREPIGGLLGADDYHAASTPDPVCALDGSQLLSGGRRILPSENVAAEASLEQ